MVHDPYGALVPDAPVSLAGSPVGPLAGRSFVAKDVFDIAGMPTGAGNPMRRATSPPARSSAVAVERLLAAGARLVGRARTDELAFGLSGRNDLDGTPRNPAAPGHLPGGSSSGPAAAVASGLADIGLGTDTGGSIRVPAAHCGLYGLRPTHGRVPVDGLVPLAPSFDTVAWLAATAPQCAAVGPLLLDGFRTQSPVTHLVVLDDVMAAALPVDRRSIDELADRLGATMRHTTLAVDDELARWREAFRVLQGAEAWASHGAWITSVEPELGSAVRARLEAGARITAAEVAAAAAEQARLTDRLMALLDGSSALVVPAAAGPPPTIDADAAAIDRHRQATLMITCLASLASLPATAQPIATGSLPMGVSLIGAPGADESLLASLVLIAPPMPEATR